MVNTEALQNQRKYRLDSIDMLRGLVIIIMAIDHVRDMVMLAGVQDPMAQGDVSLGLYLTRWVTHFCAPVFVFLAGTSVGLMSARKPKTVLAKFLLTRGLWLILVEVTLISTAITFAPVEGVPQLGGSILLILQVIWAIGASMVILAACQFLGPRLCLWLGLLIVVGHNTLDIWWPVGDLLGGADPLWYGLQTQSSTILGPFLIVVGYPVLSWLGVMLVGYGTAFVFEKDAEERNRWLMRSGLAMIGLFFVIRGLGFYGDPNPWQVHEGSLKATILDFMNVSKYPPSLLFLLATLGPMAIVCALADRMTGWLKDALVMFGRVPFAFYVVHWYVIRLISLALAKHQGFDVSDMTTLFFFFPEGFGVSLGGVYGIWAVVLIILYPVCKWVAAVKSKRRDWWLSYL